MPQPSKLVQVPANKLSQIKGLRKAKKVKCKFPVKVRTKAKIKKELKKFHQSQRPPKLGPARLMKIKAIDLKAKDVTKLRSIHKSPHAIAEIVKNQKLNAEQTLGLVYSSLVAHEYTKMKAECIKRMRKARSVAGKNEVKRQWREIVKAFQRAYSKAGLSKVSEKDLDRFSSELRKNRSNFNAVTNIANTGRSITGTPTGAFTRATGMFEAWETVTRDFGLDIPTQRDLCDEPIEGSFTKHFSDSFSMRVRLWLPCPTWTNPLRFCWKTYTIASVSFSAGVDIGYKVDCCGATAWGQGYVQACGSILGFEKCAGCSITVSSAVGLGHTEDTSGNCSYSLGLSSTIICTLAGVTVFNASQSFGLTVTGLCPPDNPC